MFKHPPSFIIFPHYVHVKIFQCIISEEGCLGEKKGRDKIIRYVLAFSIIVFLQGVLYIFSPSCTCIYSGPWPSDEYKCYS
jgi:hypothetical protein